MKKVSKEEFIRLTAGTLYSAVSGADNYCPGLMIKCDTGEEYKDIYGKTAWMFNGAIPLAPDLSTNEETGMIEKWLDDYAINEYIKPDFSVMDVSSAEIDAEDEFIIYDKEEIKTMIEILIRCAMIEEDVPFNLPSQCN